MKNRVLTAPLAAAMVMPAAAAPAAAQDWHHHHDRYDNGRYNNRYDHNRYGWNGDRNGSWDPAHHYQSGRYRERRLGRNDRIYRGSDGRYYCRRSNGTTGLVIGAIGGGLLGNAIGGNTLGTLLGAGGGALLGRSIDRGNVRCR